MSEDMMSAREVAELLGIKVKSWRGLVQRGYAPDPDGFGRAPTGQRRDEWKRETVEAFMRERKGAGYRSDLRRSA